MPRIARTSIALCALAALLSTACSKMPAPFWSKDRTARSDADAKFDPPETYPEWAYDQPEYVTPTNELAAEPKIAPDDPLHYFTRENLIMIRRPEGYTPEEIPRVGIWWTDNNGFHWNKAGYFGREQTFFPFETAEDGDYGFRFVGPGQESAMHALPYPDRVYHVDTQLPLVEVAVEPDQAWYVPGQEITVSWTAEDHHLIEYPVSVTLLYDFSADGARDVEIQRDLPDRGSLTYVLPPESRDQELRFRVDALDRANNLGVAFTHALQVVAEEFEEVDEPGDTDTPDNEAETEPAVAMATPAQQRDAGAIDLDRAGDDLIIDDPFDDQDDKDMETTWDESPTADIPTATAAARSIADMDLASLWELPDSVIKSDEVLVADSGEQRDDIDVQDALTKSPIDLASAPEAEQSIPPDAPANGSSHDDPDLPAIADGSFTPRDFVTDDAKHAADAENDSLAPGAPGLDAVIIENALAATAFRAELAAPFPATVDPADPERWTRAHPWRELTERIGGMPEAIWLLPRPLFQPELDWLFDADQFANGSVAWPVTEPNRPRALAGEPSPDETLTGHFNTSP